MSGRRSHHRFAVATPWNGAITILREVVVNRTGEHELLAVTNAAAVVGEVQTLELMGAGQTAQLRVRVVDSRPVIIDGTVRHRVRLAMVDAQPAPILADTAVPDLVLPNTERVAEAG